MDLFPKFAEVRGKKSLHFQFVIISKHHSLMENEKTDWLKSHTLRT